MLGDWGLDIIPKEWKTGMLPIDFGARSELGALNGGEAWIMDSAMRADNLIAQMRQAYLDGEEDVDYCCEGMTPYDESRVDKVYEELFGGL